MKNIPLILVMLATAIILFLLVYVYCWRCQRQAEVYRSQGVEISAFEVAIGIVPAGTPGKK